MSYNFVYLILCRINMSDNKLILISIIIINYIRIKLLTLKHTDLIVCLLQLLYYNNSNW